MELFSW